MKARLTDEQIIAMIEEQEAGEKTADVCWRHGAVRREAAEGFGRRERQAEEAVDLSLSCRPKWLCKPPSDRNRPGFSNPVLSVGVGYRTH